MNAARVGGVVALLVAAGTRADAGEFDCVIEPRQTIEIRSPVPGLITAVGVQRGDRVRAGQVLVEIDAALDKAGADVAAFRAAMAGSQRTAEARLDFSGAKAARLSDLASENFVSLNERDGALAEKRLAEAELDEARENRKLAALEHRRLLEQVRLRTVRSPIDAVVTERLMHPGELAGIGETSKPILKLADLSTLHVEVLLPVAGWDRVRIGQAVEVVPDLPRSGRHMAKVSAIDRVFDAASGTFGVRLTMANPAVQVPAGIRCKAVFADIPAAGRLAPGR